MKERLTALTLALGLLCTGCVPGTDKDSPEPGELAVWFLNPENGETGSALACEYRRVDGDRGEMEGLLTLLLSGPESQGLTSPFPRGTSLKGCRVEGDMALVDLSETYGGLSGADLSLADGCIVLTLCQLPKVERVYLTVEGQPRPFRDQVLSPNDFLLENGAGGKREMEVRLWFRGKEDLAAEERTLTLAMGDDPATAAVQALLEGPESGELWPVCPEGTALLSLTREGERYLVNVSGAWLEEGEEDPRRFRAVAATLSELAPGAQVELQVEGQALEGE